MTTLQVRPVVHLAPNSNYVQPSFGGKLLELINAPATISLPPNPPKLDSSGEPWSIDIENFGPTAVTVAGKLPFNMPVNVGETVHIVWNGAVYHRR
jgi:hypothetical protein